MSDRVDRPSGGSARDGAAPGARAADPVHNHTTLARNVLSNWTTMGLTIVSTFLVTPIVINALHKELYGVWSFLNGLLIYSDLLYLGLGSALIKNVAAARARDDASGLNRVASVVVSIYLVLGLICLAVFAGLSAFVPHFFAQPLGLDAERAATYACLLLGAQLLFSFVGSGFSGVLYGLDRVDLINVVRILSLVGRAAAIVLLVGGSQPLVALAAITVASTAFEAIGSAILAFWVDRTLVIRLTRPAWSELRVLYSFGLQSFAVIAATTLISYTDTTVIGVMLGASAVALYSLPLQLVEYVRVAALGASGVLLPRLTVLSTRGDMESLRTAYVSGTRFIMFLASFITANMIVLGAPFLSIWVGAEFGGQVQWVIVCLSLATLLHVFAIVTPYGFFQAMNALGVPAVALLAEAFVNLALSIVLAHRLGIAGVAIGTLIPAAIVSCFVLPPYLWRRLSIAPGAVARAVAPAVMLLAVVVSAQLGLGRLMGDGSYLVLAARVAATAPLTLIVFLLMFPATDRMHFAAGLKGVMNYRKGTPVPTSYSAS